MKPLQKQRQLLDIVAWTNFYCIVLLLASSIGNAVDIDSTPPGPASPPFYVETSTALTRDRILEITTDIFKNMSTDVWSGTLKTHTSEQTADETAFSLLNITKQGLMIDAVVCVYLLWQTDPVVMHNNVLISLYAGDHTVSTTDGIGNPSTLIQVLTNETGAEFRMHYPDITAIRSNTTEGLTDNTTEWLSAFVYIKTYSETVLPDNAEWIAVGIHNSNTTLDPLAMWTRPSPTSSPVYMRNRILQITSYVWPWLEHDTTPCAWDGCPSDSKLFVGVFTHTDNNFVSSSSSTDASALPSTLSSSSTWQSAQSNYQSFSSDDGSNSFGSDDTISASASVDSSTHAKDDSYASSSATLVSTSSENKSNIIAIIIGASVGGFIALIAVGAIAVLIVKSRRRKDIHQVNLTSMTIPPAPMVSNQLPAIYGNVGEVVAQMASDSLRMTTPSADAVDLSTTPTPISAVASSTSSFTLPPPISRKQNILTMVPTDKLDAANHGGASERVEMHEIARITEDIGIADSLTVGDTAHAGVTVFRVENMSGGKLDYQVNAVELAGPYIMRIGEIQSDDKAFATMPREQIIADIILTGVSTLVTETELVGTIPPRKTVTFAVSVCPTVYTRQQPYVCIAAGTAFDASASTSASKKSTRTRSATPTPARVLHAVSAVKIGTTVAASPLLDPAEVEFGKVIGSGAYGSVCIGKWSGTTVAIKSVSICSCEVTREEIVREINALTQLRSTYIVQMFGVIVYNQHVCMILEYARLGSVDKLARIRASNPNADTDYAKRVPMGLRMLLARDAAKGMAFLAESRIIHRDLKPGNLLVMHTDVHNPTPSCKLTDFGSSRGASATERDSMTKGIGTVLFMAPELFLHSDVMYTTKSDVYAYALTLYQILTGLEPYDGTSYTAMQIPIAVINGERLDTNVIRTRIQAARLDCVPPVDTSDDERHISQLIELVTSCWHSNADQRPQFSEIVQMLAPLSVYFGVPATTDDVDMV